MRTARLKTKPRRASVPAFLSRIGDPEQRRECRRLTVLMRAATGKAPVLWGPGMIGFGSYHYRYGSGREGDWFLTGFAPRKGSLTIYLMDGVATHKALLKKLGPCTSASSCLYIRRLDDIHLPTLRTMIRRSIASIARRHRAPSGARTMKTAEVSRNTQP